MKATSLIILLLVSGPAIAQPTGDLTSMVDAEKAFIEMAKTQNRRDAFLFFLSDSAVTQGVKGPTKGKARLLQQPVTEDWLDWEVAFSDIAASGDFGYNTGPWNYRPKKSDEKAVAFGEFNSVWKKLDDGTWKNVLDIGIGHGAPAEKVSWATTKMPLRKKTSIPKKNVLGVDGEFQSAKSLNPLDAYRRFLSAEGRMMVSGELPFVGMQKLENFLAASPPASNLRVMGSETSRSNDLGYVYGTTNVTVARDGKEESKTATFVRIWKLEDTGWKIVLDVLTY